MSDHVPITPGSGANIATDTLSDGRKAQAIKLMTGADGVDGGVVTPDNALPVSTGPLEWLMRQLRDLLLSPRGYDSAQNRMRETAIIESGTVTIVSTVTTVSTVSNITAGTLTTLNGLGTLPAEALARHQNLAAWQVAARSRIT